MNYKEVLKDEFHEKYLILHENLYEELEILNDSLIMLEKAYEAINIFTRQEKSEYATFFNDIRYFFYRDLVLRYYRLTIDQTSTSNLIGFQNAIYRNLKINKADLSIQKLSIYNKDNKELLNSIKEARNEYIGHRDSVLDSYPEGKTYIKDLQELKPHILELNKWFADLSFEANGKSQIEISNLYVHRLKSPSIAPIIDTLKNN